MIIEKIDLFDYFHVARNDAIEGTLTCYRHSQYPEISGKTRHPGMLILPGGGYSFVSEREGDSVAVEYFAAGFDCFVLKYDVAPRCSYPVQLQEAAMAMMYIRKNAEAFDILPDKIAAIGFSAGGHLLGCISILWDDPAVKYLFGEECELVRPDASIYSYAVISSDPKVGHSGSFQNFCGTKVLPNDYSLEKKVRPSCKPAFIWANTLDNAVPVEGSIRLYQAFVSAGVPAEMHLFRGGWHGLTVCNEETDHTRPLDPALPYSRPWLKLSQNFLAALGFARY